MNESFLVLRAQAGDLAAYDALLRGVEAALFRYLCGILRDHAAAEDVLQDVFVIVYRKLGWLKDPALFKSWVFRIASREAFRRGKKRREEVALDEDIAVQPPALEPHLRDKLPMLIGDLSDASKAVLLLHYAEELSLDAISDILDLPLGTVKSRLHYALVTLRKRLNLTTEAL